MSWPYRYRRYNRGQPYPLKNYEPTNVVKDATLATRIEVLVKNSCLSSREIEFVSSIASYYVSKGYLSQAQYKYFEAIEKRYSQESIEKIDEFRKNFSQEQKENFELCCDYYKKHSYYSRIWQKRVQNLEYIPTEEEYRKICCNKYSLKLIVAWRNPPKFKKGELVKVIKYYNSLRKYNDDYRFYYFAIILGYDKPQSPINGGKIYKLFIPAQNKQAVAEERDIRRITKKDKMIKDERTN